MASDAGVGLSRWVNSIGAGVGYVAPMALMVGSAYYTTYMSGTPDPLVFGTAAVVSLGGSVLQAAYQGWETYGGIDVHTKAGHPNPRWASFKDVMAYVALPATIVSTLAGAFVNPGWGIVAGTVTGLAGMSLGLTTHNYRIEKYKVSD